MLFFQQDAGKVAANMIWIITAIFLVVFVILLAIFSTTMGAILSRTRKSVKTVSVSKLTTHQQGIHIQVNTNNAVKHVA